MYRLTVVIPNPVVKSQFSLRSPRRPVLSKACPEPVEGGVEVRASSASAPGYSLWVFIDLQQPNSVSLQYSGSHSYEVRFGSASILLAIDNSEQDAKPTA